MSDKNYKRCYFSGDGHECDDGEYVLTPIIQDDKSVSFWLAKKGFMVAHYCFTVGHGGFSYEHQIKNIKGYISLYKSRFE